jgi:predicted PurR-regulated permease PerM
MGAIPGRGRRAAQPTVSSVFRPAAADGSIYRAAQIGMFLILLIAALSYGRTVFLPLTAALLAGLLLGPMQTWIERRRVPPFAAASLILFGFIAVIVLGVRLLAIPFETWRDRLPEMWAALRSQLYLLRGLVLAVRDAQEAVQRSAGIEKGSGEVVLTGIDLLRNLAIVPSVAAQIVLFFGVLFFLLASRSRLRAQLLSLCSDRATRLRTARIIQESERAISGYVGTVTIINFGLGATTALILAAIGTPNAGFWGAVTGVLNFIPYLGPAVVLVLLTGVGLVEGGTGLTPYVPALLVLTLHVVEANFVTPTVLGARLTVEPLLVIVSLAVWLWLWGPTGAFLAVPLLLVTKVVTLRLLR